MGDVSFSFDVGDAGFYHVKHSHENNGHIKCIEEFIKAARGESAEILTDGSDTIKTVEVAEAAYISNFQKSIVELPVVRVPWDERIYK